MFVIKRIPADKQAPDIVDSLITSPVAAYQRGRNFLDDSMSKKIYHLQVPYRKWIHIGNIIEINDSTYGEVIKGKVISHKIIYEKGMILSDISIEAIP